MSRSLFPLFALSAVVLLGTATAQAQQAPSGTRSSQSAPRKAAPGQPVTGTAKRSSSTTKASGATRSSAATPASTAAAGEGKNNDSDTPNTVNANGSIGSQESADSKSQGVYAAPGMPVNVPTGKTPTYDGKARKPASTSKGSSTRQPGGKP